MKPGIFKGAMLEYLVRQLLKNCGFRNVKPDNTYTFTKGGLHYVNGRGAAHDADVFMNPPIQMPFTYPTQLIFECKAYSKTTGLPIVRNALGFRRDVNEFEIVTKKSLKKRQNNRRTSYAIKTRNRVIYQIGVACINKFSKPAIEFAANNKIPLISLSWFLGLKIISDINSLNQSKLDMIDQEKLKNTYNFFKDRDGDLSSDVYIMASILLNSSNVIGDIITFANAKINFVYVGLLETGDIIFLNPQTSDSGTNILESNTSLNSLIAKVKWYKHRKHIWLLEVYDENLPENISKFDFHLPKRLFEDWKKYSLDNKEALNIKSDFFTRIFVFNHTRNPAMPFVIINIDVDWLTEVTLNENQ